MIAGHKRNQIHLASIKPLQKFRQRVAALALFQKITGNDQPSHRMLLRHAEQRFQQGGYGFTGYDLAAAATCRPGYRPRRILQGEPVRAAH